MIFLGANFFAFLITFTLPDDKSEEKETPFEWLNEEDILGNDKI